MRIAIVDEEENQVHEIEERINSLYENIFLIDGYYEGKVFLEAFRFDRYDLVYLDIRLNNVNGIDVAREIKKIYEDVLVVLMIAHLNHYKYYESDGFHLLEKPIDNEVFKGKFNAAVINYRQLKRRITFKTCQGTFVIPVNKIILLETSYKYCKVITVDQVYYGPAKQMADIRKRLYGFHFMQIHRSYTINFNYVSKYEYHEVYMVDGTIVPIARSKVTKFKNDFKNFVKMW
ncbi:MAG: LytTR family DNA-binding domain-containing protein [Erysipelotrichaceae bacterium]|nr:LytTR family DNA-binding domain-containing protein [Erysipelotrichaceae bacterium]